MHILLKWQPENGSWKIFYLCGYCKRTRRQREVCCSVVQRAASVIGWWVGVFGCAHTSMSVFCVCVCICVNVCVFVCVYVRESLRLCLCLSMFMFASVTRVYVCVCVCACVCICKGLGLCPRLCPFCVCVYRVMLISRPPSVFCFFGAT